ncbi:hypothetical protein [Streptomyces sp. NPDC051079]|uniref:hypothetical protein n=1 Tax=Streptomyces sp. NPDC051079 TaxID=3155043 RepID=UPI00344D44FB
MHRKDVPAHARVPAVDSGEGRSDVDVVAGVAHRDPPAGALVPVRGDTRGVHHRRRDFPTEA